MKLNLNERKHKLYSREKSLNNYLLKIVINSEKL